MIFKSRITRTLIVVLCLTMFFMPITFANTEEKVPWSIKNVTPEIEFDEGIPMPPVVRPVIILSGTDYELGYQYFTQLVQINGKELTSYQYDVESVYRRDKIHKESYSKGELCAIAKIESAIKEYAPEWIDILHGMADGAKDSGLDITYNDLLVHFFLYERMSSWGPHTFSDDVFNHELDADCDLWSSSEKKDESSQAESNDKEGATCSGFAAWGQTTTDGKLLAGGSGDDSEGNFSQTIVVFPKSGNNFITQTFNLVSFGGFPNHPNMNNQGLVRVHHGGSTYTKNEVEAFATVPRGIADMHTIRFANNAEEALEMFLSFSPGRTNMGSGCFYVDVGVVHDDRNSPTNHAFVCESRDPVSIRRPGDNEEGDFIYATNNWFTDVPRGGVKTAHGGHWYEDSWYWWSVSRNNNIFDLLNNNQGKVDAEFMKMMYRYPSMVNESKTLEEIDAEYWDGDGSDYNASVGSLENSSIAVAVPDKGYNGIFYVSTGAVGRLTGPAFPGAHQYQPGKTWTYFELKLAESPKAVAEAAREVAIKNIESVQNELSKVNISKKVERALNDILAKANDNLAVGEQCMKDAENKGKEEIYYISRATRSFAAAQAYANQVYEALVPPKTKP